MYLKPRPYTHKDFWSKDGYYTFIQEGASPDPTNLFISTFQVNAYRIERAYRVNLRKTKVSESVTSRLEIDDNDRIF
jgi:hypothetical protein